MKMDARILTGLHKTSKPRFHKFQNTSMRTRVRFPAAAAAFLMEAKSDNARVYEILAHIKDPQVVEIDAEPSTTTYLLPGFRFITIDSFMSD